MGGFRKGGFSNSRFVLKPDVAIASEASILRKNSLAITNFYAKKTHSTFNYLKTPFPGTPPFAIPENGTSHLELSWHLSRDRRQDLCCRERHCLEMWFAITCLLLLDFRACDQWFMVWKCPTSLVIFFSLTEAHPDPTQQTRNGPKTEPNGAERTRTEPNGAEMDRNQALSGGMAGVCRDGGGWGL